MADNTTLSPVIDPRTATVRVATDLNTSAGEGYAVNFDAAELDLVALATDATKPSFSLVTGVDGSSTETTTSIFQDGGGGKCKLGGTVAIGDYLVPTTGGKWIVSTTDKDQYGAIARKAGVINDLIPVNVVTGFISAT